MASVINTNSKFTEARAKVVKIQKKLFKNELRLIAPHRYVVAMSKMNTIEKSTLFKKSNKYLFVLFNDMLLWADIRKGGRSYKLSFLLAKIGARYSAGEGDSYSIDVVGTRQSFYDQFKRKWF
ncbi:hypothetical protein MHBO_004629 [Bonamia ostreae]|uniref:Uncharacterized protein n=1 Tax=Bonamia ostreae TaxID=126728 RepID=A0ABV2ATU7_9EUKA